MKIDQTELIRILKKLPFEKTFQTKTFCPSPEELTALLRFELSDQKRGRVMDHLADCSTCAREIKFINKMLAAEKVFNKEAAPIFARKNLAARKKGIFIKFPFPKISWNSVSAAAVIAAVIFISSISFLNKIKTISRTTCKVSGA